MEKHNNKGKKVMPRVLWRVTWNAWPKKLRTVKTVWCRGRTREDIWKKVGNAGRNFSLCTTEIDTLFGCLLFWFF